MLVPVIILLLIIISTVLGNLINPALAKLLYDKALVTFDPRLLLIYISISLFVIICSSVFALMSSYYETSLSLTIAEKIKSNFLKKLFKAKYPFFTVNDSGFLQKRMNEDTILISEGILKFINIAFSIFFLILLVIFLYYVDFQLFKVFTILIGASIFWMILWMIPIHRTNLKIGSDYGLLYSLMWETFQGIREIKIKNLYTATANKINEKSNDLKDNFIWNSTGNTLLWQFAVIFNSTAYILVLLIGYSRIENGSMTLGLLLGLLGLIQFFLDPIQKIFSSIGSLQSGFAAAKRFSLLIKAHGENRSGRSELIFEKEIRFNEVSFAYTNQNKIISLMNLTIKKGTKAVFVGKTGSGKSTIINLLANLYDSYEGEIAIDGVELRKVSTLALRKKIICVPQEVIILDDTIRNNIDFHGKMSDDQLMDILRLVNLDLLVSNLEYGLNTIIGPSGITLSGGEGQRLSIARCLVTSPDILILDEMTSGLDPKNEELIVENILKYFYDKTVICISHAQKTHSKFDLIYIFENGKMVEVGPPELISRESSRYRELFAL